MKINGIAKDVGDDVAEAIDNSFNDRLRTITAVCGSYLIEVRNSKDTIVVSAFVPKSLLKRD